MKTKEEPIVPFWWWWAFLASLFFFIQGLSGYSKELAGEVKTIEEREWTQLSDNKSPFFTAALLFFREYDQIYIYDKDRVFIGVIENGRFIPALKTPGNEIHPMPDKKLKLPKKEAAEICFKLNQIH